MEHLEDQLHNKGCEIHWECVRLKLLTQQFAKSSSSLCSSLFASVAQLAAQFTCNEKVTGSTPV